MTEMEKAKKAWYKRMWIYIVGAVLLTIVLYLGVQGMRCAGAVKAARENLASYGAVTAKLSYGNMSYVDRGEGEVILSVHGMFGGYDQAYNTCEGLGDEYRIIAPSRFGYLGSDMPQDSMPARQASAYVELLDTLGIDKAYVPATSAGGSVAIQFALNIRSEPRALSCIAPPCRPLKSRGAFWNMPVLRRLSAMTIRCFLQARSLSR